MKTLIAALALAATGVASAVPVTTFVASYGGSDYYTVTDDFDGKLLWTEAQNNHRASSIQARFPLERMPNQRDLTSPYAVRRCNSPTTPVAIRNWPK